MNRNAKLVNSTQALEFKSKSASIKSEAHAKTMSAQDVDPQFDPLRVCPIGDAHSAKKVKSTSREVGTAKPKARVDAARTSSKIASPVPGKTVLKNLDPIGARERVLAVHRTRLRYVTDRQKLLVHDGTRYGEFLHLAEGFTQDVLDKVHYEYVPGNIHVTEDGHLVEEVDLRKYQAKLRTLGMIQQVLNLVRLDQSIQTQSSAFDVNPYEINLLNGLFNLQTQVLTPHNPSQLVTRLAPVCWVPDTPCPFWEAFIDDITCRDKALAAFLQRLCGYCLTGSTQEEVMPILHGNGANGKSRFLGALRDILGSGEYALTLGTGSILNSKYHGIRCDLRLVEGMRTIFAIEANEGSTLDQAVVKTIVAADEISARALYNNPVQFVPQAKIIMAVNHLPVLIGNDHGMRRRIQVVPFRKRFDGSKKKEEIESQIRAEKPGIFAWMVRGFQEWRKQGLNPPEVVRKATEDYFASNDHIGAYLNERTVKHTNSTTEMKHLYEDYKIWSDDSCVNAIGKIQFNDAIESRGFLRKPSNGKMRWYGIALKYIG